MPDMADAIWTRIEQQLDIDLPTDDGGSNDPAPLSPSGPSAIGWGLSVVLLALLTAFLLYKNDSSTKKPSIQLPASPNQKPTEPAQKATGPPNAERTVKLPDNTVQNRLQNTKLNTKPDSARQQPVVIAPLQAPDSLQTTIEPLVAAPAPKDTATPAKKKRGVSGINDGDYRIVPTKKDSL